MTRMNQQWLLSARPVGMVKESDFTWQEEPLPPLAEGQILVRTMQLSLDPTNRGWMNEVKTYLPPVELGEVMRGLGIGVVEESQNPRFAAGDLVQGLLGWQKFYVGDGRGLAKFQAFPGVPHDAYLGLFGKIGLTAYFGLLEIGEPKEGETLVVSAAAGAVGSIVCQIGKIKGLRVIGIAGSDEKCRYLTEELGIDGAINYKTENVKRGLRQHCPDGIDVYFDNVGGEILDAVLGQINLYARIVLCGLISMYNATEPVPGPYNLVNLLSRRGKMQGFIVIDYQKRADEAIGPLAQWYMAGKIKYQTTVLEGLEQAPEALTRLFSGDKKGKLIIEVSEWV